MADHDAEDQGARPARLRRALLAALSAGGYAFTAALLVTGFSSGQWPFPGGDVVAYFAPAGEAVRTGGEVYVASPDFPGFRYGPPWAVAFGALALGGAALIHIAILLLDAVALWVLCAGSLRRLGYLLWFPLVSFELAAGQLNLVIAGAIVAAQRGTSWPLAVLSFAKVWPMLALRRRGVRSFAVAAAVVVAATLPWAYLWPAWVQTLISTADAPHGPLVPVPFLARAVLGGGLILLRRPWSVALGTVIVSPNLYWGQLVALLAPVALLFDHRNAGERPADGATRPSSRPPWFLPRRETLPGA